MLTLIEQTKMSKTAVVSLLAITVNNDKVITVFNQKAK